ncbi:MAG TPA: hypothetical protein VF306_08525, partial [Pirellulales bacterium]
LKATPAGLARAPGDLVIGAAADRGVAEPLILTGHSGEVLTAAFDSDGHGLATGDAAGVAQLWKFTDDGPSDKPLALRGHTGAINALAFSGDHRWLATASADRTARLWDLHDEDPASTSIVLRSHTADLLTAAVSRDGRWFATAGVDPTVRLWQLHVDELLATARRAAGRQLTADERQRYLISEPTKE